MDLSFRKITLFDAPVFAKWRKDLKLGRQVGWAIDSKKWDLSSEKKWIQDGLRDKSVLFYTVTEGSIVIGRVGLYNIDFKDRTAEVSILIGDPKHRKGGKGKKMLSYILEKGYNELSLKKIYATIFCDNEGAIRFFENNNFKKSGKIEELDFLGEKRNFFYLDHIQSL